MLSRNTNDDHSIKGMGTQGVDAKNGPSPSRPSHSRVPLRFNAAIGVDMREHTALKQAVRTLISPQNRLQNDVRSVIIIYHAIVPDADAENTLVSFQLFPIKSREIARHELFNHRKNPLTILGRNAAKLLFSFSHGYRRIFLIIFMTSFADMPIFFPPSVKSTTVSQPSSGASALTFIMMNEGFERRMTRKDSPCSTRSATLARCARNSFIEMSLAIGTLEGYFNCTLEISLKQEPVFTKRGPRLLRGPSAMGGKTYLLFFSSSFLGGTDFHTRHVPFSWKKWLSPPALLQVKIPSSRRGFFSGSASCPSTRVYSVWGARRMLFACRSITWNRTFFTVMLRA